MTALAQLTRLAAEVDLSTIDFNADLPLPNLYTASVYHFDGGQFHVTIAADHTNAAMAKLQNWCAEHHRFRPYRSNCKVRFRRMKLGDLLADPTVFDKAYQLAVANQESDILKALDALPSRIAVMVGKAVPPALHTEGLWRRLGRELRAAAV